MTFQIILVLFILLGKEKWSVCPNESGAAQETRGRNHVLLLIFSSL